MTCRELHAEYVEARLNLVDAAAVGELVDAAAVGELVHVAAVRGEVGPAGRRTGRTVTRAILLLLSASALAGVVALEVRPRSDNLGAGPASILHEHPAPSGIAARPPAEPPDRQALLRARPLFVSGRRPAVARATAPALAAAGLPRVAGIVTERGRRSVIFAAAVEGGRPLVVTEGADVNGFKVELIEAGQVRVVGPDGPRVLRPSFDPHGAKAAPVAVPRSVGLPGLPDPQNLTGIPGLTPPIVQ